jgi:DNA-binding XRE family transcriptional regulator/mannose-6-phosphate isomerase-like protein (cupin superfamily)
MEAEPVLREEIVPDDETEPKDLASDAGDRQVMEPTIIGHRIRQERLRRNIGLRELARRVDVSPSLISQIELGRATPSVSTLYSIVQELSISLDQLFAEVSDQAGVERHGTDSAPSARVSDGTMANRGAVVGPLVRCLERQRIHLGSGVTWESMSPDTGHGFDFLYSTYDVGGESAAPDALIRHDGKEYGHLLEGRLGVTVGFTTYTLEPGDSISFDSTTPHRLFNMGDVPAKAIWCVIGRDEPRGT